MILGDIKIGNVFRYEGALFAVGAFDWDLDYYPNICLASRNPKYDVGGYYQLNQSMEIDELISSQRLKDFIPKDIDYEME